MGRSAHPRVSVVVPTCNEARNIELLLPAIAAVRPPVSEIIVSDGGSTDGTAEAALRVLPGAKVVRQTRSGKGNALACGFAAATGEVIVSVDADGAGDPREIPALVAALVAGADFAAGSRFVAGGRHRGVTGLRRARLAALGAVARAFFGATRTDLGHGYHAFWADLLPVFELPSIAAPARAGGRPWGDGTEIETLLGCRIAAAGRRLAEVPSVERGTRRPRTCAEDRRVLRVLATERRRARRRARRGPAGQREQSTAAAPAGGQPLRRSELRPPAAGE
jgi:glycosyltransferase involved in cell wall biosynthesis